MYDCDQIGCPNKVSHIGQLCLPCEQEEDDDHDDYDDESEIGAAHLCIGCGQREAILNGCCAMCTELRPDLMGYAG